MKRPFDLVHVYTRSQALADGVLVDVTRQASPVEMLGGFTVPVAVTASLWAAIEAIPGSLRGVADVRGRLHDVLWMARVAAARCRSALWVTFNVILPCRGTRRRIVTLALDIGPGDGGEPVATIGFPEDF